MIEKEYQKEIDYFYEAIKNNKGPIADPENHKTLKQIAQEAPRELDSNKLNEIREYLRDSSENIETLTKDECFVTYGSVEKLKTELERKFLN